MLLSHRYNFLFVHIAKTGGTSVRDALDRLRWQDPKYYPMWLCSRLSALFNHELACKLPRHAKAIAAQEMLPRELYHRLFKFAFVRNPWDLQVSSYHHLQRERPQLLADVSSFEAFIRFKLDPQRPYQYHLDTSIELQSDYLVDLHGRLIVDFIGHYERFDEDFEQVCQRIGITPPQLPHKRKATDRRDYRSYYSDALAEQVAEHFRLDIERLHYRFDP